MEDPENDKETSRSAHANGMNECIPPARTGIKIVAKENIVFMLVSVDSKWDVILHVTFHGATLMKYLELLWTDV